MTTTAFIVTYDLRCLKTRTVLRHQLSAEWRFFLKVRVIMLALSCVAGIGVFCFYLSTKPPRERVVIQNFYEHRDGFGQLQAMLSKDENLKTVATWGVETTDPSGAGAPLEGSFPKPRYQRYLELLKTIHADRAGRDEGPPPVICFGMWRSGFAGETRHVEVCYVTEAPANIVASLDAFYRSPKPRHPVYRRIEGNWYIWADW